MAWFVYIPRSATVDATTYADLGIVARPGDVYQGDSAPSAEWAETGPTAETVDRIGNADGGRGTLYLKATCADLDVSSAIWSEEGNMTLGYELDTDKSTTLPDWVQQTEGGFVLTQAAAYAWGVACKGVVTYPDVPDLIGIDIYDNNLSGVNLGHTSDGSDDSPAFTPQEVTPLDFLCKEGLLPTEVNGDILPITLTGFTGENQGDLTGATLTLDARLSLTQLGGGTRYTDSDFTG